MIPLGPVSLLDLKVANNVNEYVEMYVCLLIIINKIIAYSHLAIQSLSDSHVGSLIRKRKSRNLTSDW